jgi:tetratricopeptide (TPR) repeat protein
MIIGVLFVLCGDVFAQESKKPDRQQLKQTLNALQKKLEDNPNNAQTYVDAASYSLLLDDFVSCSFYADKAVALNANIPDAHMVRGTCLIARGKYEECIPEFKKFIQAPLDSRETMKSNKCNASFSLAVACMETMRFEDALVNFNEFLQCGKFSQRSAETITNAGKVVDAIKSRLAEKNASSAMITKKRVNADVEAKKDKALLDYFHSINAKHQ